MIKSIQEGYNLLFLVFVIICLYGGNNSKELESNYTVESNNNIEQIRTESNTEWGILVTLVINKPVENYCSKC